MADRLLVLLPERESERAADRWVALSGVALIVQVVITLVFGDGSVPTVAIQGSWLAAAWTALGHYGTARAYGRLPRG